MSMIPTIVRYLVQGVAQHQIADIVGCSESYISEVKNGTDYPELAEKAKKDIQVTKEAEAREKRYASLEDAALAHLEENLPFAEYNEAVKLLDILNRRKQGNTPTPTVQNNTQVNVVNLTLPAAAVPELVLNNNREVIGIGDKSLSPMGAGGVRAMFIQLKQRQEARIAEAKAKQQEEELSKPKSPVIEGTSERITEDQM